MAAFYDQRNPDNIQETIELIAQIKSLMQECKIKLRDNYKFYSQDLLNNLFKHPYTKIEFVVNDLKVSRITAASYLNKLADDGLLKKPESVQGIITSMIRCIQYCQRDNINLSFGSYKII